MTSPDGLWLGLRKLASGAGWEVVYRGFLAYYLLIDAHTPIAHKSALVAALGYLIAPLDVVPDALVGIGFVDDLAVLAGVFRLLDRYVTPEIQARAKSAADAAFGLGVVK